MGFPSPALDYTQPKLSIDEICNTRAPSVYLFKSDKDLIHEGIKRGAVLVINSATKPSDGNIIAVTIGDSFRLVRYRTVPCLHLQELNDAAKRMRITEAEAAYGEEGMLFGVVTHVLNDVRMLDS